MERRVREKRESLFLLRPSIGRIPKQNSSLEGQNEPDMKTLGNSSFACQVNNILFFTTGFIIPPQPLQRTQFNSSSAPLVKSDNSSLLDTS
ncbi:unnamed protein product [Orchesella dallaii]|uniref:Uncharacterized protein n=1 Tax=Orchesella dallaii TaxID=48710 RepID=A0ABP1QLQ8_9HEXA